MGDGEVTIGDIVADWPTDWPADHKGGWHRMKYTNNVQPRNYWVQVASVASAICFAWFAFSVRDQNMWSFVFLILGCGFGIWAYTAFRRPAPPEPNEWSDAEKERFRSLTRR
jgi:hypothetical protein